MPGLGRRVEHDPRSLAYPFGVIPQGAIKSASWTRRAPILDQGNLGSCTGNALAGYLGTDRQDYTGQTAVRIKADGKGVFQDGSYTIDEDFAVKLYSLNTKVDTFDGEYPPTDTGSSGLACAKSLKLLGLSDKYQHVFSYQSLQSAIQTGPCLFGTVWLESMFALRSSNFIIVDPTSGIAGGHELVVSGYDAMNDYWRVDNSWGTSWGDGGSAYIMGSDMRWLLSQDGDVTVPHLVTTPNPPKPSSSDCALWNAIVRWAKEKGIM